MDTRARYSRGRAVNMRGLGDFDTGSFVSGTFADMDYSAIANSFGTGYDQQVASQTISPVLLMLGLLALFVAGK